MSWSSDITLPERQPGEALRDIQFHNEMDEHNRRTDRVVGNFRHRDGRIWSARIVPMPDSDAHPQFLFGSFVLTAHSGGCRRYQFISSALSSAKQTALRFGNVRLAVYDRLIADAQGTTEFPRSADVGAFRIHVVRRLSRGFTQETVRYTRDGIGRLESGRIVIFPDAHELEEIFDDICAVNTVPLIPEHINSLGANSTFHDPSTVEAAAYLGTDMVADPTTVVLRNFDDSIDDALAGLSNGTYRTPTIQPREDRVIDLNDGDDDGLRG
jgi:hypothetical protein